MRKGTCIHFKGLCLGGNTICGAGVDYRKAFDGKKPGVFLRMPCVEMVDRKGETVMPCPINAWQEPTDEQIREHEAEWEQAMGKTKAALKVAAEWRVKPKPAKDRQGTVECPVCKGVLHLSQSSNGHVWGKCETDGCVSWME